MIVTVLLVVLTAVVVLSGCGAVVLTAIDMRQKKEEIEEWI